MAPVVASVVADSTFGNLIAPGVPTGTSPGDVLIYAWSLGDSVLPTTVPADLTEIATSGTDGTNSAVWVGAKIADGTETGFTFGTAANKNMSVIGLRITGGPTSLSDLVTGVISIQFSTAIECPAVTSPSADALSLLVAVEQANLAMTYSGGYTEERLELQNNSSIGIASNVVGSGSTGLQTATIGSSKWNIGLQVLVPAGATGGRDSTGAVEAVGATGTGTSTKVLSGSGGVAASGAIGEGTDAILVQQGDTVALIYTVTDTAGNTRVYSPVGEAVAAATTAPFGALTPANTGAWKPADNAGNYVSLASVDDQTGATRNWSISNGGLVADGTPDVDDGQTITVTTTGGSTFVATISTTANEASAASVIEMKDSILLVEVVRMRPGTYIAGKFGTATPETEMFRRRAFGVRRTISSYDKAKTLFTEIVMEENENVILDSLRIERGGGVCVTLQVNSSDIAIQNCDLRGTIPIDTDGDYSSARPTCPYGVFTTGSPHNNVSILNNSFSDTFIAVRAGDCTGTLRIEGNESIIGYEDGFKITQGPTSTIVTDNHIEGLVANGSDLDNPHADPIQFIGAGSDWTGIRVERNTYLHTVARSKVQGFFFDDMSPGFYYTGAIVRGNVICNWGKSQFGIRINQAKDCEVDGNTIVGQRLFSTTEQPGIVLGGVSAAGVNKARNNAAAVVSIQGESETSGNVTVDISDYGAAFTGTNFEPTSRDELFAEFGMLANGTLDLDNSGGPSVGDAGAIGSGFVTWPSTLPGNDGSLDLSYLPSDAVTYAAFDEAGVPPTAAEEISVSTDGGSSYSRIADATITLSFAGGRFVFDGFTAADVTTPLFQNEENGLEPFDRLGVQDAVFLLPSGMTAPANTALPGWALAPTKDGNPT